MDLKDMQQTKMPIVMGSEVMFNRELMICNPSYLKFLKVYTNNLDLDTIIIGHKTRLLSENQRKERINAKKKSRNLFNNNNEEQENIEINHNLGFGNFPPSTPGNKRSLFSDDDEDGYKTPEYKIPKTPEIEKYTAETSRKLFDFDDESGGSKNKSKKVKKTIKHKKTKRTKKNRKYKKERKSKK